MNGAPPLSLRVSTMLHTVLERLGTARGAEVFDRYVCALGELLDLPYVMIGDLTPGCDRVRTLSTWNNGELAPPGEYPVRGACWEGLPAWHPWTCERAARGRWHGDALLSEVQAESCAVVALSDSSDHLTGLLFAADRRPRPDIAEAGTLLAALAGRVAAVLERERMSRELDFRSRLLDAVGQVVVAWDLDWRVTYGNRAAEQLFGWTLDEGLGRDLREFLPRLRPADDSGRFAELTSGGRAWFGEVQLQDRGGSEFVAAINEQPLRDSAGQLAGAVATVADISRRTEAEHALSQSEGRLRALFSHMPVIMWAVDASAVFTFCEGSALAKLGLRQEDVIGESVSVLFAGTPAVIENHARALAGETFRATTERAGIIFEVDYQPLRDRRGRVTGVLGLAVDVTERARVEAALREGEELGRATFDSLDLAVTAIDHAQNVIGGNRRWRKMLGECAGTRPPGGGVGTNYFETCRQAGLYAPDVESRVRRGIEQMLAGDRRRFRHEYGQTSPAPGGQDRWMLVSVSPLTHGLGGAIIVHHDVTERRRNAELEIRLRSAEAAEQMKDDLLSTVSHELRTPLAVIRGYLSTIAGYHDRLSIADIVDLVNRSQVAASQLEKLVSDILVLSRLDAGMLPATRRSISIRALVNEALAQMRVAAPGREFIVSSRIDGGKIRGDRSQLRQVLYNLLDNAIKYAPADTPIEIDVVSPVPGTVSVCVRDRGPGVPADELEGIFQRFHRIRNAGNAPVRGAGLGLAICRAFIDAHDGRIEAALAEDGGLAVTFTLPLVAPRRSRDRSPP